VLWTYIRNGARLRYEVRLAMDGDGYELILTYPGGQEVAELYGSRDALKERTAQLERQLAAEGWWLAK
jgi:hypothetical protein